MRSKKFFISLLSFILIFLITSTIVSQRKMRAYDFIPPEGSFVVSKKETQIVPGVVETEVIYNTPDGQNPVSGFIVDINLGSSVNIMVASKDYDQRGTQTVREMAAAAEAKTGRNIVAAINADLNWSGTGISNGPLIIDGVVHNDVPALFFGIKKNGEAVIGDSAKFLEIKDELYQASKGMGWLVKDGQIMTTATSLAPRTAVGLKADGTVFFYVVEGRMFPRSVGISTGDLAKIMRDYGAVMALNMDGGGSTTYLAKMEGETSLELRNIPSDGRERESLNSLLVYAEVGDGTFHHAAIATEHDLYTPNSEVQFTARGVDSAGGYAELPEDLIWKLEDNEYGTIDDNGLFTSSGKEGVVQVYLEDTAGRKVGHGSVEIRTPDEINFRSNTFSLGFNESSDFGLRLSYNKRDVKYKDGDIIWNFDPALGEVNDNVFTSNPDTTVNGTISATIKNTEITKELFLEIGKLPIVLFDFEDDESNANWIPGNARMDNPNVSFVHKDSGEPVRFGNKAMRIDFDFTTLTGYPAGAYAGFTTEHGGLEELGGSFNLPGSPTGLGMWIYIPEEVSKQHIWLRTGVLGEGMAGWAALDLYKLEDGGADWVGWKYVEADLTGLSHPIRIIPSEFVRLMLTSGAFDENGKPFLPVGSVYVDNITVSYGTNPEDLNPPVIDSIKINGEELIDGQVLDTNNITIETTFYDFEDQNSSGINYENINIYVDGINYINKEGYALDITGNAAYLQNFYLPDGLHEIKVVVIDNVGNETVETRYITVDTGSKNKIYFEADDSVILGKDYIMTLKADEIENIDKINFTIRLSEYLSNYDIEFSEAFNGEVEYLSGAKLLNVNVERVNDENVDHILKLKFSIARNINANIRLNYNVLIGQFEYIVDDTDGLYLKSFTMLPQSLKVDAPLLITSNIILVGQDAVIEVYDQYGNPVENAEIFTLIGNLKESIGFTNEYGILTIPNFMNDITKVSFVAELEEDVSFEYATQIFDSYGNIDGTPYNVVSNGVKDSHNSKTITWLSNALAPEGNAIVQYALKSEYLEFGESAYVEIIGNKSLYAFNGSTNVLNNYAVYVNNVEINNLLTGKEYVYRVGDGTVWSDLHTFTTAYQYSDVEFFILGDIQSTNYENIRRYIEKIFTYGIDYDFGIQVGDFIDTSSIFSQWNEMLLINSELFGDIDIVRVLGNHEYTGDLNGDIARGIFNLPESPDNASYYSLEYGLVYIGVINYTPYEEKLIEALEWLVTDAEQSNARWKIVITHQPPYYSNPSGGSGLFNELLPSYAEQAGIDFVFSGHDHVYTRTKPLINGEPNNNGVVYITTGSVGEKRYDIADNPNFHFEVAVNDFTSLYLSVVAKYDSFEIIVRDPSTGEIIDSYSKNKPLEHEHSYYIDEDRLICVDCHHNRPVEGYTGFVKTINEELMYIINGDIYKGILNLWEDIYYFGENGLAYTGHKNVWGLESIFDDNGRLISGGTGFVYNEGNTYYYERLQLFKRGWKQINGNTYYFSTNDGHMYTGKQIILEMVYDFSEDGILLGEATPGFIAFPDGTLYLSDNGILHGWHEIEGYTYYFSTLPHGYMRTGRSIVEGKYYNFTEDGKLIS